MSSSSCVVWHAPLGVRSAKRRHQSPEWTILSHSYRLIQGEIVRPQVLLDSLHPRSSRTSWWSPPVLRRGSIYDTPGICLVWHSLLTYGRTEKNTVLGQ